ncbi:MAG: OmpH family outer membrane protein [Neisseria sp.]|nr:OmpH family outer membrane protein [Neisseria sp.]
MSKTRLWMKCAAAALAGSLLAAPAAAETVQKLGFINTERVYLESKQAQSMVKALEEEFAPRRAALEQQQAEGIVLQQKIAKTKGAQREREVRKLAEMSRNFRLAEARLAEEYDLRRNEEFAALQQSANRALVSVAKKGGYDLIVQDVLFIDSKFDITDEVIREMNR